MRLILLMVAVAGFCVAGVASAQQADAPHGAKWVKQKVQTCASCHGPKGVSTTPNFPTIAGQYENYLVRALTDYRDKTRKNAIMNGMVSGLTDAQIKALAQYFSAQKSPLHTPSIHD